MKRLSKTISSMIGVTLLEIMLVLAIAAMVIVMSVRYYQSATSAQQANALVIQIQSIVAAADSLSQATGSYLTAGVSNTSVAPLLPGGALTTPWGDPIRILNVSANSFRLDLGNVPRGVCPLLRSRLSTNNHFSSSATAAATLGVCNPNQTTAWTVFYLSNP